MDPGEERRDETGGATRAGVDKELVKEALAEILQDIPAFRAFAKSKEPARKGEATEEGGVEESSTAQPRRMTSIRSGPPDASSSSAAASGNELPRSGKQG